MARRWLGPALVAFLASASLWVGSSALLARQTTGCLRVEARDSATDRLVHSRFYRHSRQIAVAVISDSHLGQ